jgi:hypothetical protein
MAWQWWLYRAPTALSPSAGSRGDGTCTSNSHAAAGTTLIRYCYTCRGCHRISDADTTTNTAGAFSDTDTTVVLAGVATLQMLLLATSSMSECWVLRSIVQVLDRGEDGWLERTIPQVDGQGSPRSLTLYSRYLACLFMPGALRAEGTLFQCFQRRSK